LLKGKTINGFAEPELDECKVERHLAEYIQHFPMAAKPSGIRMENKIPSAEDIARIAKDSLSVKVKLD